MNRPPIVRFLIWLLGVDFIGLHQYQSAEGCQKTPEKYLKDIRKTSENVTVISHDKE